MCAFTQNMSRYGGPSILEILRGSFYLRTLETTDRLERETIRGHSLEKQLQDKFKKKS